MYFISDLDKTLIYSRQKNAICVEKKENKEITYVTLKAKNILDKLLKLPNFYFIPCTLRSIEQTMRVDFIRNNNLKYIICDNGASIYVNGTLDNNWDNFIDKILDREKVFNISKKMNKYVEKNNIPIYMIKTNRNAFISIIFFNKEDSDLYIDKLLQFIDDDFDIFRQDKKTYIVPKKLNKKIALEYLKNQYHIKDIVTSGDSNVDNKFVELGDIQIIPKHSVFKTDNAIITQKEGIEAGEEILQIVASLNS